MSLEQYYPQLVFTVISFVAFIILRSIIIKLTQAFGRKSGITRPRTSRIIKYLNLGGFLTLFLVLIVIWGFQFNDLGWIISSVFAVIGVALFAQWSILSNITSGIVMFFTFPYRIGDFIVIHDKDYHYEGIIQEIASFHVIIKSTKGEIITYPNSMMLQKGVTVIKQEEPLFSVVEETPEFNSDKNVKEQPID